MAGAGTVVGDVLAGFTVTRRVRVRDCHAVYEAESNGETVALKTLCHGAAARDHSRMDNELAALRQLERFSAAPDLLAVGSSAPQRYFAMSWRPGTSLRRYAEDHEVVESFADLAASVCQTYADLHRHGVAHGDVSRHNILVDATGGISLVDFESSASTSDMDDRVVRRRFTWSYAAPEFAVDATTPPRQLPTPATDQYAVAAVLYRVLTGRHPRAAVSGAKPDSPGALRVRARPMTGPAVRRCPELRAVFATALRLRPSARFADMAEFAAALKRCSASLSVASRLAWCGRWSGTPCQRSRHIGVRVPVVGSAAGQ